MQRIIELRLIDASFPDGEIALSDLAALGYALQELTTRIGREVLGTPGPGRTKRFMEELSSLRLRQLTSGSTVLSFVKGPLGKLDVDLPDVREADERFWEVVGAIASNSRPDWVSDLIADSAGKLANALRAASPVAVLGDAAGIELHIDSAALRVETWTSPPSRAGSAADVAGLLEKVDLRSHEFRVRDDVGQGVELRHVLNDGDAARLVGQWVIAHGEATENASGRTVYLNNVTIESATDPADEYTKAEAADLAEILASAPGPDPQGGVELSDDEFDAFLRAARS